MLRLFKEPSFWLIAPYAAWMVLMMTLPSAPWAYSVRTVVTLGLLVVSFAWFRSRMHTASLTRISEDGNPFSARGKDAAFTLGFASVLYGFLIGLLVLVIWIAPDHLSWYRQYCVIGDPYSSPSPLSLASPFVWIQLFGSAFVISAAEELFFRKWMIRFAGFWWMIGLFAIEHNRPVVAAICGILYGLLYLKKGLPAAIVAHATTNLLLGLYVIYTDSWEFW